MDGHDFFDTLQRLGFENLNNVSGQSFAWIFDCEPLLPFLDWFCGELHSANVLFSGELQQ